MSIKARKHLAFIADILDCVKTELVDILKYGGKAATGAKVTRQSVARRKPRDPRTPRAYRIERLPRAYLPQYHQRRQLVVINHYYYFGGRHD